MNWSANHRQKIEVIPMSVALCWAAQTIVISASKITLAGTFGGD